MNFTNKGFAPFKLDKTVALLEAEVKQKINTGDGDFDVSSTKLDLFDCAELYPDLIKDDTPIGGPESKILCLDPKLATVQGVEYLNTFK